MKRSDLKPWMRGWPLWCIRVYLVAVLAVLLPVIPLIAVFVSESAATLYRDVRSQVRGMWRIAAG